MGTARTFIETDFFRIYDQIKENMEIEKMLKLNSLPSLFCRVRYAHATKQTPRQKMANAIIWLCLPTTSATVRCVLYGNTIHETLKTKNEII